VDAKRPLGRRLDALHSRRPSSSAPIFYAWLCRIRHEPTCAALSSPASVVCRMCLSADRRVN
jgi:hypothetical protein